MCIPIETCCVMSRLKMTCDSDLTQLYPHICSQPRITNRQSPQGYPPQSQFFFQGRSIRDHHQRGRADGWKTVMSLSLPWRLPTNFGTHKVIAPTIQYTTLTKKTSLSMVLPTRKYVRDSHNHSERQVLHNVFTSCLVGTRGTTNSSSMQADIHLCQSRLVLTSKLCPCWMRVGTTCQANFSQVSHCLSNSLTDLTDMQSKFANCNMQ